MDASSGQKSAPVLSWLTFLVYWSLTRRSHIGQHPILPDSAGRWVPADLFCSISMYLSTYARSIRIRW